MHHSVREQFALRQAAMVAFAALVGIRADAQDPVIAGYMQRQVDLQKEADTIVAAADGEKRELTAEEKRQVRHNLDECARLEEEITLRNQLSASAQRMSAPQPRQTPANASEPVSQAHESADDGQMQQARPRATQAVQAGLQTSHLQQPNSRLAALGNGGFRTLYDFSMAVRAAATGRGLDQRLQASLSTYGSEGVGADGGFLVPPDYRTEIMQIVQGEQSLFSRCDASPTASNSVTLLKDATTPWGTNGVRVYTRAEAGAMTQSKAVLTEMSVRLNEVYALVPLTEELLQDAPLMQRVVATQAGRAIDFKLTDYIINGTGVGQPLGIMNSGALVTVSKESSQVADTIHAKNIIKMWARMPAWARGNSVWLVNQDCETQIMQLGLQVGSADGTSVTGGMPLYMPPGGLSGSPYATLLGKPVFPTEACAALGDLGDIVFAHMPGYFLPYKAGGIRSDMSIHLWFDQAMAAFRWMFRFGGQPWLDAPIARKNGSNTLSHFVTLEAR